MPVFLSYDLSSPTFIILSTFLLCGSVIGAFWGSNLELINSSKILLDTPNQSILNCFINALKYNLIALFLSRFAGFLIPFFVLIRGYLLSFSISLLYNNSISFLDKSVLIDSVFENIVAIPCFLIICSACLNLYFNNRSLNKKRARMKANIDGSYVTIIFMMILNIVWNIFCILIL